MKFIKKIIRLVRARPLRAAFFALPILALGISLMLLGGDAENASPNNGPNLPLVELISLAELSNGSASLPLIGIIESTAEADIQTQRSGTVTSINFELGDFVPAGALIASLDNQSEAASVAQAQASLASAEASLAQTVSSVGRSTDTTRENALQEYRDAYTTATDAVENKTEPFFTNDRSAFPNLTLTGVRDSERLEDDRAEISDILRAWERDLEDLDLTSDLLDPLMQAISDLRFIESFLNDLSSEANRRTNNSTEADRAALATARTSVSAQLATLVSTHDTLRSALENSEGGTGEKQAQIAAAEASVAQARANLDAALASLEETRVRSPIAGYLNALPLKVGQSVGAFAPAATVINPDALEIVAYISPSDRELVTVGNTVKLNANKTGTVTHVAPGASTRTGKIEIRIAPDSTDGLTAGNSIAVSITNHISQEAPASTTPDFFSLPITAIKFKSDESVIFTVNDSEELVEHPVSIAQVLGSSARVSIDLAPSTRIVVDARGLVAGDEVEVTAE